MKKRYINIASNPNNIKFFRYARLGENANYGIDKMLAWERLTKGKVEFSSDLVCSTITYWFGEQRSDQDRNQPSDQIREQPREQVREQVQRLVNVIREDACSFADILKRLHLKGKRNVLMRYLTPAIEGGYVLRAYPDKPNHPNQRYYLSEKGLKLVKRDLNEDKYEDIPKLWIRFECTAHREEQRASLEECTRLFRR